MRAASVSDTAGFDILSSLELHPLWIPSSSFKSPSVSNGWKYDGGDQEKEFQALM